MPGKIDTEWYKKAIEKWGDWIRKERPHMAEIRRRVGCSWSRACRLVEMIEPGLQEKLKVGKRWGEPEEHKGGPRNKGGRKKASQEDPETKPEEDDDPAPKISPERKAEWLWESNYVYNADTDTYITFTKSSGKPMVMSGTKHRQIIQMYSNWDGQPSTINMICRDLHIPRPWLIEYLRIHGITHDKEPFSKEELESRPIEDMVEDAIQMKRQAVYQKFEKLKWRDTKKNSDNWMEFEEVVLNRFIEEIGTHVRAMKVPKLDLDKPQSDYVAVVANTDFHWGMYSWEGEVGPEQVYNFDIAEERLFLHTENLISRFPGRPKKIIMSVGSDFFHIDGQSNTTTRGTVMDTIGTPTEILVTGCHLQRRHIDLMRQVAPVEIWMMAGNHDQHNSRAVLLFLSAWYKDTEDVTVHLDFRSRVYTEFGDTLIGFNHGDGVKVKDLGACMAKEARHAWSRTKHHIFFGGHLHHHKVQEVGGITHHLLPSLAGIDRYHHHEGYITTDPTLMAYLIDEEDGPYCWLQSKE